ncbi:phage tail family protein [Staphylococcus agnetis]|uniref:Phage tail family protein n=2 Tax=Staphylococcus agnetis TaxID=985762 RepID=A0AAW9Z3R8_9STAP|nr:phage tail family protein [Staphylococcus agnetis]
MTKLNFPVGVKPLDFLVSSIQKERYSETIPGIPGNVDYGFDYKQRDVTLTFWLRHYHGEYDYLLLQSELNAFLDSEPFFYASTSDLPTRVLKITIDDTFIPDRILGSMYAKMEVKAHVTGIPFWQSRFTTQHLEKYGYDANSELFGSADGINIDCLDYSFTTNEFNIWNGGSMDLDPRNMYIKYILNNVTTSGGLTIENTTTGEKFIYNQPLSSQTLTVNQTKVNVGVANRLRDSNRDFPTLKKGLNHFKITNGTFSNVDIDFRYVYK